MNFGLFVRLVILLGFFWAVMSRSATPEAKLEQERCEAVNELCPTCDCWSRSVLDKIGLY